MDLDPPKDGLAEMDVDVDDVLQDSNNDSFNSAADEPLDLKKIYQDALEQPSEEPKGEVSAPAALAARAYQIEMFEASLKQNIIVAV